MGSDTRGSFLRGLLGLVILYLIAVAIFLPGGWLVAPMIVASIVIAVRVMRATVQTGSERLGPWPAASVICLAFIASQTVTGLIPGVGIATYDFTDESELVDGRYIELSRSTDTVFILSCEATGTEGSIAVQTISIKATEYETGALEQAAPSLFNILFNDEPWRVGLSNRCPDT